MWETSFSPEEGRGGGNWGWKERERKDVQEASFRRHISMNCLISDTSFGMVGERSGEVGFCSFLEFSRGFSIRNWQNVCECGSGLEGGGTAANLTLRFLADWNLAPHVAETK